MCRVFAAPESSLRPPASPGSAAQAAAGAVAAAGKCEAHQLRAGTYVPSARGVALAELACPADASAGEVSHRGAALSEQGRAGQGRQDSCAAGLARVWWPALVPPLVPRTSQWHAVPSHAPGCLAPEVARAGT